MLFFKSVFFINSFCLLFAIKAVFLCRNAALLLCYPLGLGKFSQVCQSYGETRKKAENGILPTFTQWRGVAVYRIVQYCFVSNLLSFKCLDLSGTAKNVKILLNFTLHILYIFIDLWVYIPQIRRFNGGFVSKYGYNQYICISL